MLKYAGIIPDSTVDGPGIRTVIFMQGCINDCPGCHNPQTHDINEGEEITPRELAKMVLQNLKSNHAGLTLSGGDPFLQDEELCEMLEFVKKRMPDLNIWAYTGYLFDEIKDSPMLKYLDVVVDGPFIMAKKSLKLIYCGSANQRLIDVKKTLAEGKIVELKVDRQGRIL